MRINIINRAFAYAIKKANGKTRSSGLAYPRPFNNPPPPIQKGSIPVPRPLEHPEPPKRECCDCPEIDDVHPEPPRKSELARLRKEHEFMLKLLVDIQRSIDSDKVDLQQIAVAIKQLRGQLGTDKLLDGALKPGLERE